MSFQVHIQRLVCSCNRLLGFILRFTNQFKDPAAATALFNSLIRSRLEYAAIIWEPSSESLSANIEKIQKRFLRALYFRRYGVYPSFWNFHVPTAQLLIEFNFQSLKKRREQLQLLFLLKLVQGKLDFEYGLQYLAFDTRGRSTRNNRTFRIPFSPSKWYSWSPLVRLQVLGNSYDIDWFDDHSSAIKRLL